MNNLEIDEQIELVPFDLNWKVHFKIEAERIQKAIGERIIKIEHIGSTSIPNIVSKPIIDIMIGVKSLEDSEQVVKEIINLGYQYLGEANVPGRLYFRRRNGLNFNIALCTYQGDIWSDNILFRDYLIAHPEEAQEYSQIKQHAFDLGFGTLLNYSSHKGPFIVQIINKAKKLLKK